MRIGQFRNYVAIERATMTRGTTGQAVPAWSTWKQWWCRISPISGREAQTARAFAASVSHKIEGRFVDGMLPTDRINYGGRYFTIDSVTNTEESDYQHILYCTEVISP
jgi:SPP1 family predicted phage head-tail adaptor